MISLGIEIISVKSRWITSVCIDILYAVNVWKRLVKAKLKSSSSLPYKQENARFQQSDYLDTTIHSEKNVWFFKFLRQNLPIKGTKNLESNLVSAFINKTLYEN